MHREARGGCQLPSSVAVHFKIECASKQNCKLTFSAGLTEPGSPGIWLSLSLPPLCWHYRHAQLIDIGDLNLSPHACTPLSQLPSLHHVLLKILNCGYTGIEHLSLRRKFSFPKISGLMSIKQAFLLLSAVPHYESINPDKCL